MTTYLGKSCSFCLPRVPFVNCRQFMYLVISLLVLRAGYGIWLYQFLIIAYLFTSQNISSLGVFFFWSFATVGFNTLIWEPTCSQPGARRREGCPASAIISHEQTHIIPSLLFSNLKCCISRRPIFRILVAVSQYHRIWDCSTFEAS